MADRIGGALGQFAISARARPLRVAYLVADDADAADALTAAFAECYGRWVGVRTLFVPVASGQVGTAYAEWLRRHDPDIVYSYADLAPDTVQAIDRRIGPAVLRRHRDHGLGSRKEFRPRLDGEFLGSLSVLPQVALGLRRRSGQQPRLLDAYPAWKDSGLVLDTFGVRSRSAQGFPADEAINALAGSLALTPPDAPENRWRYAKRPDAEVISDAALLRAMAEGEDVVTMAQLAATVATRWEVGSEHPWCGSLNLVVGDSLTDRLCFWNGRLLHGDHFAPGVTAVRLPEACLDDDDLLDALSAFIARRNWVGPGGSGGVGHVTVRSASIGHDRLDTLRDRLSRTTRNRVGAEAIGSPDDCVPAFDQSDRGRRVPFGEPSQFVQHTTFAVALPAPEHLAERNGGIPSVLARGKWAVDVQIERHDPQSPFINAAHWWRLPRSRSLLRRFGGDELARVDGTGRIVLGADPGHAQAGLGVPGDVEAVQSLFERWPPRWRDDLRASEGDGGYAFVRQSDKGRYLTGATGLFGGLGNMHAVLSNGFWRRTLLEMAAPSRNTAPATLDKVAKRLRSRLGRKTGSLVLDTEEGWLRLAEVVARIAPNLRSPRPVRNYAELLSAWQPEHAAALDAQPHLAEHREEMEAECEGVLRASLERRCTEGALTQGHRWTCRACAHDNWASASGIGPTLSCVVCRRDESLPADFRWDFLLNEFLAEGLREHGLLGLSWVLGEMQLQAQDSFVYAPPLELHRTYPASGGGRADKEVDVCCIRDGKFVIGEVKESGRMFDAGLAAGMAGLAEEVGADVLVLACLEPAVRPKLEALAGTVRERCAAFDCEVEVLVPEAGALDHTPYLP